MNCELFYLHINLCKVAINHTKIWKEIPQSKLKRLFPSKRKPYAAAFLMSTRA